MKIKSKSVTISVLLFVGINAIVAGMLFILEPSGSKMGMTTEYIRHSPFKSYLIPGLTLFLFVGCLSLYTAYSTWKVKSHHKKLILLQGLILGGWIIIQMLMVHDMNWLHILMLSMSVLLLILGAFNKSKSH